MRGDKMGAIYEKCKIEVKNLMVDYLDKEEIVSIVVNSYSFNDWLKELENYKWEAENVYKRTYDYGSFWNMIGTVVKECILKELNGEEIENIRGER